jgi:hypothetical protein
MSSTSRIKPEWNITEGSWVVSLLNTGSKIGGHAVIVVEGYQDNHLWVGQYDIKAIATAEKVADVVQNSIGNTQGYIYKIDIFEKEIYGRDYSSFASQSWTASPDDVRAMIQEIHQQKELLEEGKRVGNLVFPFQTAGCKRLSILGGNGADNCVTWAEKYLAIARIGNEEIKTDKVKASPAIHVTCVIL